MRSWQQARAGNAGLALVVEDGEGAAANGGRQMGVFEHDIGAFPAELELHALQIAGRGFDDLAAGGSRAGEGDLCTPG